MFHIYAAVGSLTTATRLARELERRGTAAAVTHTPSQMNKGGCSYSVKVKSADRAMLEQAAADRRVRLRAIIGSDGERYYDLS